MNEPNELPGQKPSSPQGRPPVDMGGAFRAPSPPAGGSSMYPPPPPPRRRSMWVWIVVLLVAGGALLSLLVLVSLGAAVAISQSARQGGESVVEIPYADGDSAQRVVIVPIEGGIDDRTAIFIDDALRALGSEPPAAVVLRVNSPGGTVSASDRIYHLLREFRRTHEVPIVASFGSLAASGGYYVSCLSDHIVAEPTTLTGSIGVIASAVTVEKLLDKVGVKSETVTSTPATMKDVLNPMRSWQPERDIRFLTQLLDKAHARFVDRIVEGRGAKGLTAEALKSRQSDSGEPFVAEDAKDRNLVDDIGFIEDAIATAATLGGIPAGQSPRVTIIGRPVSLLSLLTEQAKSPSPGVNLRSLHGAQVREMMQDLATPSIEYRWAPATY